jgi:hypothetical protein
VVKRILIAAIVVVSTHVAALAASKEALRCYSECEREENACYSTCKHDSDACNPGCMQSFEDCELGCPGDHYGN